MIYFCIPAHNEERTVGVVLWKLRQVMAELRRDYQIIVVDDASTDSTPAVLNPYIRVLPLTVFRNQERRGYADSLEIAIREAVRRSPYPKRDTLITLQADFTEDPDVVPALIKLIEAGADVVAGNAQLEPGAPRAVRWGRRFMGWLLRGREWAAVADPLSGLRAYRVIVMKRALEAHASTRLLSWSGLGANAELLAQTLPHSRRTETVETPLRYSRLQRPGRFAFLAELRQVRGAATGTPFAHARPLPIESPVAAPMPIAVDESAATAPARDGGKRRRPAGDRTERPARRGQKQGPRERKPRPARQAVVATASEAPAENAEGAARKRRRPRRRKNKQAGEGQTSPSTNGGEAAASEADSASPTAGAGSDAVPKKKSRRGRRGGRGRRKGARPDGSNTETRGGNGAETPPPLAAEGD